MRTRMQFILTEGVLRRGTIVGAVAALAFVVATVRDGTIERGWWRSLLLIALCFVEWSIGSGWLIGGILWSRQSRTFAPAPTSSQKRKGSHRNSDT